MSKKGQASIEALLILSAILITATYLQVSGENSFETTNAINSAKKGVQTGITRLSIQNDIKITISDWGLQNDNLIFYLTVQSDPPPENKLITSSVENIATTYLQGASSKYNLDVKIEGRTKK